MATWPAGWGGVKSFITVENKKKHFEDHRSKTHCIGVLITLTARRGKRLKGVEQEMKTGYSGAK